MDITAAINFAIMVITVIFSSRGFTNHSFFAKYAFEVEKSIVVPSVLSALYIGFAAYKLGASYFQHDQPVCLCRRPGSHYALV